LFLPYRWEKDFQPNNIHRWIREHNAVPIVAVLLYFVLIFGGQAYFEKRKPLNWRKTMALWNLSLAVFSGIGVLRTMPQLIHNLSYYGMREVFCFDPENQYGSGSTGLWVLLFILSKFPELFDTFFIVIHKKPLIFLHWYHHISVLLYCWHSYVYRAPHGLIFCAMNYTVHSIMYFYYFLMAANAKPKAFNAVYITVLQISQMVVGVACTVAGCYYLWFDPKYDTKGCSLTPANNVAALIMYGSYLALFLEFFLKRFGAKTKPTKVNGSKKDK
jgi:elongation of very long chain fatty acids protein 6